MVHQQYTTVSGGRWSSPATPGTGTHAMAKQLVVNASLVLSGVGLILRATGVRITAGAAPTRART
jgi:hypothetical protein